MRPNSLLVTIIKTLSRAKSWAGAFPAPGTVEAYIEFLLRTSRSKTDWNSIRSHEFYFVAHSCTHHDNLLKSLYGIVTLSAISSSSSGRYSLGAF